MFAVALCCERHKAGGDHQLGVDLNRMRLAESGAFITAGQCLEIELHAAPLPIQVGHRAEEQRILGIKRSKRTGVGARECLCPSALNFCDHVVHGEAPAAAIASTSIRKLLAEQPRTSTKVAPGAAGGVTLAKKRLRARRYKGRLPMSRTNTVSFTR